MTGLDIQHINLGYGETPVLNIRELKLSKPGIYTIVGKSGIGKTTFLETLGLMRNNILRSLHDSVFLFRSAELELDYLKNKENTPAKLSEVRKAYFSFIFQTTNFLDELSVLDNILISPYIQEDFDSVTEDKVVKILHDFDLDRSVLTKKAFELSGGQRQRISFIRGIVRNFSVLFGDEPTGNLDPNNAKTLMLELKKLISDKAVYAFIVTHDLDLAITISDGIIPVTQQFNKESEKVTGLIDGSISLEGEPSHEKLKSDLMKILKY